MAFVTTREARAAAAARGITASLSSDRVEELGHCSGKHVWRNRLAVPWWTRGVHRRHEANEMRVAPSGSPARSTSTRRRRRRTGRGLARSL